MTDGCVHLLYNSSCKFHQLAAGQPLSEQPVRSGKAGGTGRPTQHKSHLPGTVPKLAGELTFQHAGNFKPCRIH